MLFITALYMLCNMRVDKTLVCFQYVFLFETIILFVTFICNNQLLK